MDTQQDFVSRLEQLKSVFPQEEYDHVLRSLFFVEFTVDRLEELGFNVPPDVSLYLTLDYYLLTLKNFLDEAKETGREVPWADLHPDTREMIGEPVDG